MSIVFRSNYFITSAPSTFLRFVAFADDSTLTHQGKHLFSKPLAITQPEQMEDEENTQSQKKISQLKNRLFCLGYALINIPMELVKTIIHVVAIPFLLIAALPLGLVEKDIHLTIGFLKLAALAIPGLVIRPVRFVADEVKLLFGTIVHPSLAIGENPTQFGLGRN